MEKDIYRYISKKRSQQDSWSTREIGDAFGLNAYMARYYLMSLCHKGLLCRSVKQRGAPVRWMLPVRKAR
ncbi:hypothetical protein QWQ33_003722 [Salmonella enterica]|nr:hypothetical protein [Salmonella enterica]EBP9562479.1 hypothetical protein [Salmonella enterica subsp. enterica]EDP9256866.1 hypothetical protein [Salmonella enterica subsp. enterica serovar Newmexico]EDX2437810.1 hypothetical protein [Salmonella enterica subsp. enterica serovar Koenigstuhl]EGI6214623.1 hypothetical protein [Salmonella enterica subsp. enterica serovar Denver]EJU7768426.1 hypothetical protein [Salmonella enterica subsp. enterica serovar 6,14:a:1,7]HAE9350454.1 hypothetical